MEISKNYRFRQARSEDLTVIQQLLKSNRLPFEDITPEHLEHYFLINGEQELIAAIGLEKYGHYGLLRSLAVRKDHQKNGLGRSLVNKLEDYAKNLNIEKMFLLTTTAESFFSKLDYKKISRKHAPESIQNSEEFSNICPDSAVVMTKKLTET